MRVTMLLVEELLILVDRAVLCAGGDRQVFNWKT
jgi:hypothetical protein